MKISQAVLGAILVGLAAQTTSCVKPEEVSTTNPTQDGLPAGTTVSSPEAGVAPQKMGAPEPATAPEQVEYPDACPACGMG